MRKRLSNISGYSPFATFLIFFLSAFFYPFLVDAEVIYSIPLKGVEHQIGNMLEWKTVQEMDSELFIVERSRDGINYENIGVVNAAGVSEAELAYRYMDIGINDEQLFYRLKQVDVRVSGSEELGSESLLHRPCRR